MKYIIPLLFLVVLTFLTIKPDAPVTEPVYIPTPAPIRGEFLSIEVNEFRTENGLPTLPEEESLCRYAEERVEEIKTDWSHEQFWADKCLKTNYGLCGENLSMGFTTVNEVLEGWKNSPTHYENLKRNWSSMCIKCDNNFCAQEFGI